jgi:hypothetical protein
MLTQLHARSTLVHKDMAEDLDAVLGDKKH